jgi:hypothetical protein
MGPGFTTSKKRKRRNESTHVPADRKGDPTARSGTAAEATSWPATSSMTTHPGSADPKARQTGPDTATPKSPTASPDIKSPTETIRIGT